MVIACIMGALLGFLSGLGTGGGSLLILWLTLGTGMDQETARAVNLMFFIPAALIACCFRKKQGMLDLKQTLPAIVSGCISAAVFSLLFGEIQLQWLKKLFGVLLIATGLKEIFYRRRKPK